MSNLHRTRGSSESNLIVQSVSGYNSMVYIYADSHGHWVDVSQTSYTLKTVSTGINAVKALPALPTILQLMCCTQPIT